MALESPPVGQVRFGQWVLRREQVGLEAGGEGGKPMEGGGRGHGLVGAEGHVVQPGGAGGDDLPQGGGQAGLWGLWGPWGERWGLQMSPNLTGHVGQTGGV